MKDLKNTTVLSLEFHTGKTITFLGIGHKAKNKLEGDNFIDYENRNDVLDSIEDEDDREAAIHIISDLGGSTTSQAYNDFCQKWGDLGKLAVFSETGMYIGDYVNDGEEYTYEEDGVLDTTMGVNISSWEDLTRAQQNALLKSDEFDAQEVETFLGVNFSEMRQEE